MTKILIMEDNVPLALELRSAFELNGFDVVLEHDGDLAFGAGKIRSGRHGFDRSPRARRSFGDHQITVDALKCTREYCDYRRRNANMEYA